MQHSGMQAPSLQVCLFDRTCELYVQHQQCFIVLQQSLQFTMYTGSMGLQ